MRIAPIDVLRRRGSDHSSDLDSRDVGRGGESERGKGFGVIALF
jgi:hypothetical protein